MARPSRLSESRHRYGGCFGLPRLRLQRAGTQTPYRASEARERPVVSGGREDRHAPREGDASWLRGMGAPGLRDGSLMSVNEGSVVIRPRPRRPLRAWCGPSLWRRRNRRVASSGLQDPSTDQRVLLVASQAVSVASAAGHRLVLRRRSNMLAATVSRRLARRTT